MGLVGVNNPISYRWLGVRVRVTVKDPILYRWLGVKSCALMQPYP